MGATTNSCGGAATMAALAAILQITGLALFVVGFFPVKPTLSGFSGPESYRMPTCDSGADGELRSPSLSPDQLGSLYRELSAIPQVYDRLILMVVDGLPGEFLLGRGDKPPSNDVIKAMPYTQSLLSNRKAIGYRTKAAPPTVTMPRLKAIVSGGIGGFLDVAFNFNTQAFLDDNFLDQLFRIGSKLVMHGDETWIKLFPHLFFRKDGVSSFYVKDTVEVDFNVSRHLDFELSAEDWNVLILHYLGLDHVGHIGGRKSALMIPKLKEMDSIIRKLHTRSILGSRTLLVVLSDHGMTGGGNHGGSSEEETDALALFIGYTVEGSNKITIPSKTVFQIDIAPTLALLFGVPVPKNNIGVLLPEVFSTLTFSQRLRSFELNSWQLLRLLRVYMPGFYCDRSCEASSITDTKIETLCHLYSEALTSRDIWHLNASTSKPDDENTRTVLESYYNFLRTSSEWLSRRATDKPFHVLLRAVSLMTISCFLFIGSFLRLSHSIHAGPAQGYSQQIASAGRIFVDEGFIYIGIVLHAVSLGSSSFVEEEQYTWHFLTSTLYLVFLFMTVQSILKEQYRSGNISLTIIKKDKFRLMEQLPRSGGNRLFAIISILLLGRIIKAWHQGGINWVHFPDLAKTIVLAGPATIKTVRITSLLAIPVLYALALSIVRLARVFVLGLWFCHIFAGFFVMLHIMESHIDSSTPIHQSNTKLAQVFYWIGSTLVVLTFLVTPWIFPIYHGGKRPVPRNGKHQRDAESNFGSGEQSAMLNASILKGIRHSMYLIGATFTAFWSLLQLLLQQPINAAPLLLIYLQTLLSVMYFSTNGSLHKPWVKVAAMHFLGIAGHFGLGNTNSLATIDVAGAFIGISNYSPVVSGILMFMITFASPLLTFLGMVMCIPATQISGTSMGAIYGWRDLLKKMTTLTCLVPLLVNSVALTSFTVVLLLMRNHLFIWSVFSPKYLYACAATASVYAGASIITVTGIYVGAVFAFRTRNLH